MNLTRIALLALIATPFLTARADEASHRAAVQELLKVTKAEQLLSQSLAQVEGMQKQMIAQMTQGKDAEFAKAATDEILKSTNEIILAKLGWSSMEAEYIRVYMKVFSEEEVRGMTDFYRSPLGQKVLDKSPALMTEIMQMTLGKMGEILPEIQATAKKAAEGIQKKRSTAPNPTPTPTT